MRIARVAVSALLALALASCLTSPSADGEAESGTPEPATIPLPPETDRNQSGESTRMAGRSVPFRTMAVGTQSAVRTPVTATVTSQIVFDEVWNTMHANMLEPPAAPEIDFSKEMVVVLILGERPSAGYGVQVADVTRAGRSIEVRVEVTAPEPGTMNASVLTSPFAIVVLDATDTPITFTGDDVREGYTGE